MASKQIDWNTNSVTRDDIMRVFQENTGLIIHIGKKYNYEIEEDEMINTFFVFMFGDEKKRWKKFEPARCTKTIEQGIKNFLGWYARQHFHTVTKSLQRARKAHNTRSIAASDESVVVCFDSDSIMQRDQELHFYRRLTDRHQELYRGMIESGCNVDRVAVQYDISVKAVKNSMRQCAVVAKKYALI